METWFNGKKQKEAWIQGKKVREIWRGGKKIFDSYLPIPTDYYLALDLTSNINDKSSNAHAMTGSSYAFNNIGGKNCIEFTQGIRTTNNVTLGNIITICAEVYCTTTNLQHIVAELSADFNSNNSFSFSLNGSNTDRTVYGTDRVSIYNQKYTNAGVFSLNQWFKVIIVFDRTKTTAAGQRTIYINNINQSIVPSSINNNVLSGNWDNFPLYIGARNLTNNVLKGYMRNFRLYKRLLTDDERLALYQE